jgi:hypothetical protein
VLGDILAPLAPRQKDLVVLSGIDAESSYHGPGDASHWNGMGHMLTGTELVDVGGGVFWGGGISIDQFLAQKIGGQTRLPSLELAVEDGPGNVASRLSYLGAAQPVPPEPDPQKVFQRLFGGLTPEQIARRKSVLDTVKDDYGALAPRLGSADRKKIEAHLDALRAVEKSVTSAPPQTCDGPAIAAADLADMPAIGKDQMDLLVRALACDLTRVVSLQWSRAVSMTRMTWLGISEAHHDLSHLSLDDADVRQKLVAINRWYSNQFAYLLDALDAVPEGDGTLLDHTLVLWCNELSVGQVHSRRSLPYVLAGRAGGALKTGRFLQYAAPAPPHNDLLVSLCRAMEVDVSTFGNPAYCNGPLPGLLS